MPYKIILITVLSLFVITQCTTKKSLTTQKPSNMLDQAPSENHLLGISEQQSPNGGCPYLIKVIGDTAYFLDPVNLPSAFAQDKKQVWFTFTGLRRMNRCPLGNPIWIDDIIARNQ
jgi:hypothetical protein